MSAAAPALGDENKPMIVIFERQGWQRRDPIVVPFHPLPLD